MEIYRFPFEKLDVWQDSRRLVKAAYGLTRCFPAEEKFGLSSQINRAAVSVASNLAEGSSRASLKDQGHFSQMAYSSLMELACQMSIAVDVGLIAEESTLDIRQNIHRLANKINALRTSQLARAKK